MRKVDILQVFISASASFGIGVIWINFNEKVFKTVRRLANAPFSKRCSEPDYDCGNGEEEGYCSDDCSEAHPQMPEHLPFYFNYDSDDGDEDGDSSDDCSDDSSEAHPQRPEHPPFYIN